MPRRAAAATFRHLSPHYRRSLCLRPRWMTGEGYGFSDSRIDGSFRIVGWGYIGVHLVTRMQARASKLFNERGLDCARAHVELWYVYIRARIIRAYTESRRIPTRRASSCFLYRRAFFTANERVFGALITSAFYIIHGMEEDRGCENNRSWIIRMTMEESKGFVYIVYMEGNFN